MGMGCQVSRVTARRARMQWSNEEMDALLDQFPAGVRLLGAPLVQPTPSGKSSAARVICRE